MKDNSIIVDPKNQARASVIWLHGLGADCNDFVGIVDRLRLPEDLSVRFIFPNAKIRPVSINGNVSMRAWFDIYALDINARQDNDGINQSYKEIERLIQNEIDSGIPSNKIVLAGFSQGASIALYAGMRFKSKLAGILGLSGFLLSADSGKSELSAENQNIPIELMHGKQDQVIPVGWADMTYKRLRDLGYLVGLNKFDMGHELCEKEICGISYWLETILQ